MDWIRENKSLAAIVGVIVAGSLVLGYLLFDAWGRYTEAKDAYLGTGNQLAGLKGASLAPTEDNLKKKQAIVAEYAELVNRLGGALLILQPPVQPIKDIEFQAKLKGKIADAKKASGLAKMALPAEFAFGFDEYTGGLPKSAEAAAELSGYLDAVDELVKLFMKCGVESLDMLERSKLPVEGDATRNNGATPQGAAASVFEKRQISVALTLDQGPLQLLVARMANPSEMPFFTSLRLLRIENERQDGPVRSDVRVPDPGGTSPEGDPPQGAADEIKPPPPAPPDSVPVLGKERLRVSMDIDLVKFLPTVTGR